MQYLSKGNKKKAIKQAKSAIDADPDLALPTLLAVKAYLTAGNEHDALSAAHSGHDRWPECIFFRILIAEDMVQNGDLQRGVENLHKVAIDDPTGRLAKRYLGNDHPYQGLWPVRMTAQISRPIPADVREIFGGNRIDKFSTAPETVDPPAIPRTFERLRPSQHVDMNEKAVEYKHDHPLPSAMAESVIEETPFKPPIRERMVASQTEYHTHVFDDLTTERNREPSINSNADAKVLKAIEQEFDQIASRLKIRNTKSRDDVRQPVYVILSAKQPLIARFGQSRFDRVDEAIRALASSVQNKPDWNAIWLYVDDQASMEAFQLSPADPQNPWQIKLRITDLDIKLQERDEMIGALFIIGGNEIVPFHMLPNPTDDEDDVIPSDNPYATTDENYFAPEWPVGRIPSGDDVDSLVRYIRSAAEENRTGYKVVQPINRFAAWILSILTRIFRRRANSLGYTANIWRKASLAVFRAIGNPGSMVTSPPAQVGSLPPQIINPVSLSYYNLHGLEDAPEWFGQRDPFEDAEGISPDFPIALRPEDIINGGRAPKVVFTEACYGANVLGKTVESAICLKFLDSGSKALVGSTKISYGSVTPPLIAADLLGRFFWDGYVQGYPVGEALRRAKLQLASEMHQRQGYLDGEDQKTLISFVLFGDPLWTSYEARNHPAAKGITRKSTRPAKMKTACALGGPTLEPEEIEPEMMSKVRSIVYDYLPGMADAVCKINPQHPMCNGEDHVCPTHQLKLQKDVSADQTTVVVSFAKHIAVGRNRHPHYARLTLDKHGKVLKLAVSR